MRKVEMVDGNQWCSWYAHHEHHWLPSTEMAQRIAEEMDITKVQVEAAREAILAAVKDALR